MQHQNTTKNQEHLDEVFERLVNPSKELLDEINDPDIEIEEISVGKFTLKGLKFSNKAVITLSITSALVASFYIYLVYGKILT